MAAQQPTLELDIHPVDASRWGDLVRLIEGRGGPKHCWCLVWRERGAASRLDLDGRRAFMEQRVRDGTPIGLLAYLEGDAVAWCSIAPRDSYRPLGGDPDEPDVAVWSVVCFFVQRRARGQGVATALLDAAIEYAAANGADVVEGYPVDPDSPSYRFMGQRSMFLDAGFEETRMAGTRRHVMRRRVSRDPASTRSSQETSPSSRSS